jgi:hypothetical protein
MERAGVLINRLQEQYQQNEGAGKMLITLQLLAAELQEEKYTGVQKGKSVSVVIPVVFKNHAHVEQAIAAPAIKQPVPFAEVKPVLAGMQEEEIPVQKTVTQLSYDPLKDIPTLTHQQKEANELNDVMGGRHESLNDKLKAARVELGSVLQSSPVKDLKKAIGINDRYVFLNELFRGDEVMYERSIKTINAFTILAEAEFWIKRELKLKLGWNENSDAVEQFDHLVRRRFS